MVQILLILLHIYRSPVTHHHRQQMRLAYLDRAAFHLPAVLLVYQRHHRTAVSQLKILVDIEIDPVPAVPYGNLRAIGKSTPCLQQSQSKECTLPVPRVHGVPVAR